MNLKKAAGWFSLFILMLIIFIYSYGETLQNHKSPEEQTKDILAGYLAESGETDRMPFAKCFRMEETKMPEDVSFYLVCEIKEPPSAHPIALSVAFGRRGQVEFMDMSRGGK